MTCGLRNQGRNTMCQVRVVRPLGKQLFVRAVPETNWEENNAGQGPGGTESESGSEWELILDARGRAFSGSRGVMLQPWFLRPQVM